MVMAYILISISESDLLEVVATIRAIPHVRQAHALLGPTDCIALIACENHEILRDTILRVRAAKGVTSTDTRYVYD